MEIRGSTGSDLVIILDEPLQHIKYANFEAVQLLGDESAKRRPNYQTYDPSDHFDYVPESERIEYNISAKLPIEEKIEEEVEIVPYEVYLLEKKKAKTVTFYGWEGLEILRIHDCKLDELYWEIFDGLESLQHLSLEHNQIKVVPPFTFFGAMHIRTLSLARNNILDLHYRGLAGLLKLEQLDLSYNSISKLSELSFPPFPKLEVVDLRDNPIRWIFPATFGVMNSTTSIYFGSKDTALELNSDDSFLQLEKLQELMILNATADAIRVETFRGLNRVERITIRGDLNHIEFDAFSAKPFLKVLDLNGCKIEEISMDTLFGITHLEIVDLSSNRLTSIPHGLFDEQHHLREIYLQDNYLTELPHNFFDLPALKLARLTGNPWICTCEMAAWKQGVTNALRVEKWKQAPCQFQGEFKTQICDNPKEKIVEYVYNKQIAPRCGGSPEPMKDRSLFYVLRRDLKCNMKKHTEKAAMEKRNKKERIAQKSALHYAKQANELRWHNAPPTVAKLQSYDYQKIQRQKEMERRNTIKMANSIMRDINVESPSDHKYNYRKYRLLDPDDNNILSGDPYY